MTKNHVNSIASFNQSSYAQTELGLLNKANITCPDHSAKDWMSAIVAELSATVVS